MSESPRLGDWDVSAALRPSGGSGSGADGFGIERTGDAAVASRMSATYIF